MDTPRIKELKYVVYALNRKTSQFFPVSNWCASPKEAERLLESMVTMQRNSDINYCILTNQKFLDQVPCFSQMRTERYPTTIRPYNLYNGD